MPNPADFLTALSRALASMTLYPEGHPTRCGSIETAYQALVDLRASRPQIAFTFLEDETLCGDHPIRDLDGWSWSQRLARAGLQRVEFSDQITPEQFDGFLNDVLARLTLSAIDTSQARPTHLAGIKYGAIGVRGAVEATDDAEAAPATFSLGEEADMLRWLHDTTADTDAVPMTEAVGVVESLAMTMHADNQIVLPLLRLKEYDQYTTTHSLNVSVLSMGLAEFVGYGPRAIRTFGVAGLVHDLGKVRVPIEILNKPGRLSDRERAVMSRHPADGARLIFKAGADLDLPAVVAYEHHIMLNGEGYPRLRYRRPCHPASNLVHVCDVYDALRTDRPYRDAWPSEKVLGYIEERAGIEFDPEIARHFVTMMRQWESRLTVLSDEDAPIPPLAAA